MIEDDVEAADRLAAVAAVAVAAVAAVAVAAVAAVAVAVVAVAAAAVAADASARWLSVAQPPQPVQIQPHAVRLLPTAKLLDVRLKRRLRAQTCPSSQNVDFLAFQRTKRQTYKTITTEVK